MEELLGRDGILKTTMSPACDPWRRFQSSTRVKERGNWNVRSRSGGHHQNHQVHPLKLNFAARYTLGTWIWPLQMGWNSRFERTCPFSILSFVSIPGKLYIFSCAVPRDRAKFPSRMEKFDRCNGRKWKVNEVFTCASSSPMCMGIAICRESAFTSSRSFSFEE